MHTRIGVLLTGALLIAAPGAIGQLPANRAEAGTVRLGFGLGAYVGGRAGDIEPYGPAAGFRVEATALARGRLSMRTAAGLVATLGPYGDDTYCLELPGGGCRDKAAIPGWIGSLDLVGALRGGGGSIVLLAGGGVARSGGWRRGPAEQKVAWRPTGLIGVELRLTESTRTARGTRLQLTHRGLWGGAAGLDGLTMLSLTVP